MYILSCLKSLFYCHYELHSNSPTADSICCCLALHLLSKIRHLCVTWWYVFEADEICNPTYVLRTRTPNPPSDVLERPSFMQSTACTRTAARDCDRGRTAWLLLEGTVCAIIVHSGPHPRSGCWLLDGRWSLTSPLWICCVVAFGWCSVWRWLAISGEGYLNK